MRKAVCSPGAHAPMGRQTQSSGYNSNTPCSELHVWLDHNFQGIFKTLGRAPKPFCAQSQAKGASELDLDPVPSAPQAAICDRGWKGGGTHQSSRPGRGSRQGKWLEGQRPGRGAHWLLPVPGANCQQGRWRHRLRGAVLTSVPAVSAAAGPVQAPWSRGQCWAAAASGANWTKSPVAVGLRQR